MATAITGCASDDGGSDDAALHELVPVTVLAQPAQASAPIFVAEEKGYFEDAGLDVTVEVVPNVAAQVPLLVSGQAQFALGGNIAVAVALGQGLPFEAFAASAVNETAESEASAAILVNANSAVRTAADLEGLTVAMAALKGQSEYMVRIGVEAAGGDPDAVRLIQLDQASSLAALDAGEVDAAQVFQPFVANAIAEGKRVISYPALEHAPGVPSSIWYGTAEYLDANADVVDKMTAAIDNVNAYLNDNPDEANEIVEQRLEMPEGTAELLPAMVFGGELTAKDMQGYLDDVERYGWAEKEIPSAVDVIWARP